MNVIHVLKALVEGDVKPFLSAMSKAAAATRKLRKAWGDAAKAISSSVKRLTIAIVAFGTLSATVFARYERVMVRVKAVTNATKEEFELLDRTARRLGSTTKFTARQVAEAMASMGLAGLKTHEIVAAIPGALQLASAAQLDVNQAADVAAKTMRSFGFAAADLTRINNDLVGTFTNANTDLPQLAEGLKQVGPVSKGLGVSLEETTAVIAKMSDAGFQGGMAGTAFRNILARLAGAVPAVTNKLADMGVETTNARGEFLGFLPILKQLEQQGLTTGQVLELFGARGGPQLAALLEVGSESIEELIERKRELGDIARRLEQEDLKTLAGQFDLLKSAVEGVFLTAGGKLKPELEELFRATVEFIEANRVDLLELMVAALKAMAEAAKSLLVWLTENREALTSFFAVLSSVVQAIADLVAHHPRLAALLGLFGVASMLGITNALSKLLAAIVQTALAIFTQLIPALKGAGTTAGGAAGKSGIGRLIAALGTRAGGLVAVVTIATGAITILMDRFGALGKRAEDTGKQIERTARITTKFIEDVEKRGRGVGRNEADPAAGARGRFDVEAKNLAELRAERQRLSNEFGRQFAKQQRLEQTAAGGGLFAGRAANDAANVARRVLPEERRATEALDAQLKAIEKRIKESEQRLGDARVGIVKEREEAIRTEEERAEADRVRRARERAEKIGDEIQERDEALERSRLEAQERVTPGFGRIRDFLMNPQTTGGQAAQFVGNLGIGGATPGLTSAFGRRFGSLTAEQRQDPKVIEALTIKFLELAQAEEERAQKAEEAAERMKDADREVARQREQFNVELGQSFQHLSETQVERFKKSFERLAKDLRSGAITSQKMSDEVRKLNQAMQTAAEAAKAEAEQELRRLKIRILSGRGTKEDFQKFNALRQARMEELLMERFNAQLDTAWNRLLEFGAGTQNATKGLGVFQQRLERPRPTGGGSGGGSLVRDPASAFARLGQFMSSPSGLVGMLQNRMQLALQRAQFFQGRSARKRLAALGEARAIGGQLQRIGAAAANRRPIFSGVSGDIPGALIGAQAGRDGGPQSMHIEITLPHVNQLTAADLAVLREAINVELARVGSNSFA